jgi:hypothetical protein
VNFTTFKKVNNPSVKRLISLSFLLFLLNFSLSAAGFSDRSRDFKLPDEIGNLIEKESITEKWKYRWSQSGMLTQVIRPDRKKVDFIFNHL